MTSLSQLHTQDRAADGRPQRDGAGASRTRPPQRCNQGESRGIGHAGGETAKEPSEDQDLDGWGKSADERSGDRQRHTEDGHHFAPVAVAQGAEPED